MVHYHPSVAFGYRHGGTFYLSVRLGRLRFALTLTPSGKIVPLTIGIYKYIGAHEAQWNLIMASSVLASLPGALLLILAQRYVAAGLTVGAVKG